MKIRVRSFNERGIERFRSFLQETRIGGNDSVPEDLIESGYLSDIYCPDIFIESKQFDSKSALVHYIYNTLNQNHKIQFHNPGLWTWLSAFFFDSVCPVKNGERKLQAEARYVLNIENWNRYYRHLIATPVRLLNDLGDLSKIYLSGPPHRHGDLLEQLASRQEIATNKGIVEAAAKLYWDEESGKIKKGARNKTGEGVLRRFTGDIIPQFQMTYDLNSMQGNELLNLLPAEFNKWLSD